MIRLAFLSLACALLGCGRPGPQPLLSSQVLDFPSLFAANCSGCHGQSGREGPGPPLNDALYLHLVPRGQLQAVIENGRPGTAMPAFARAHGGPLNPPQVTALINGIEESWAKTVDLQGADLPPYAAPLGDAQRGQSKFEAVCASCHGPGRKIGPVVDRSFLSLVSDQGLRTTIIVGRPLFGMPDWRRQGKGGLSKSDVSDLVAWLASNRPHGPSLSPAAGTGPTQGNEGSDSRSIQGGPGAGNTDRTPEKRQ